LLGDLDATTLRRRPQPAVWSALEYAAHTRDVLAGNGYLMHTALEGRSAAVPTTSPDQAADAGGYNQQDPAQVLDELEANAMRVAKRAERASQDEWPRDVRTDDTRVQAGLADHGITDALAVLRHAIHEAMHHLGDVERNLAGLHEG